MRRNVHRGGRILALAAGYTDNVSNNLGYLSMVATVEEARGQGLAVRAVTEFLNIAREKELCGVHLYAVATNTPANPNAHLFDTFNHSLYVRAWSEILNCKPRPPYGED